MSALLLFRLTLDGIAVGLMLIGLAYWWLGNGVHELAGTVLFLLVILHNLFNRRWYGALARTRRDARRWINIGVTVLLAATMLVLFVTSLLISETLSGIMPPVGGFTVRQIHTVSAYWMLVIVAVHLGLRWPMIMGLARSLSGITQPNAARTLALRAAAAVIAGMGVWSSFELGLGSKLAMRMTLDWWNFEEAAAGFFLHCLAIVGLWISATHYSMAGIQCRKLGNSLSPVPENLHQ